MNTMKINYRRGGNGIRTTITLSSALVDTWLVARLVARDLTADDWNLAISALREFIEDLPEPKNGETFQSVAESFLLLDIRECLWSLK